ncbi:MAG: PASTA domain-containing protein [Acidimicrobiales bacterium]
MNGGDRARGPTAVISRAQRRLPSRTGTLPATVTLAVLAVFAIVFAFSPTLNPIDILAGRFLEVPVPQLVGLTQDRALVELERGRLHGDVRFVHSSTVDRGKVVRQRPVASSTMRRDSYAKVYVSRGPAYVQLPELAGSSRSDAIRKIRGLGLDVDEERLNDETVPIGTIISRSPPPAPGRPVRPCPTRSPPDPSAHRPRDRRPARRGAAFMLGKAGVPARHPDARRQPLVERRHRRHRPTDRHGAAA